MFVILCANLRLFRAGDMILTSFENYTHMPYVLFYVNFRAQTKTRSLKLQLEVIRFLFFYFYFWRIVLCLYKYYIRYMSKSVSGVNCVSDNMFTLVKRKVMVSGWVITVAVGYTMFTQCKTNVWLLLVLWRMGIQRWPNVTPTFDHWWFVGVWLSNVSQKFSTHHLPTLV